MSAASRLFARFEPLAYADAENDGTLEDLCTAWMAPVEICEVARDALLTVTEEPTTVSFADESDGALGSPWLAWSSAMPTITGGKAFDTAGLGDATRPELVGPDCSCELVFDAPLTLNNGENFGIGLRLTAHSGSANGYMFEISDGGTGFRPRLYKGSGFATVATGSLVAGSIDAIRMTAEGSTITGYFQVDGVWTQAVQATDATYTAAGYPGFWVQDPTLGADLGATQFTFNAIEDPVVVELTAWESLFDPDACPAELLDWLAVYNGVVLPPSALTEAEKRSRIKQAAGRYRGTEQAWTEEIQRSLTGYKVVRIFTFVAGDRWAVTIKTRTSETPDPAAVERTARAGKPAGLVLTFLVSDEPIWAEGSKAWNEIDPGVTWANATVEDVEE